MSTSGTDLLIIGSGVAGLSAAVAASDAGLSVRVVTKGASVDGTTRWAQGGVAAVTGVDAGDSTDVHLADTLAAGGDFCDADAVRVLVDEGPMRVDALVGLGAEFDRDPDGTLQLAIEGGHTAARVVHAGGSATGAEITRALDTATRSRPIGLVEHHLVLDLLVEHRRCVGVRALRADGETVELRADHVLLAAGGAGQLFAVTTNPTQATGGSVAMALRAGVGVCDVEFMQFHPTALHVPSMPRPLLTEALRGHGAVLRTPSGERFVDELQPRDVVSRAETAVMLETGSDHVFLDVTGLDRFAERFGNIAADLARAGLDPSRDLLPVAPAAHYLSGGVPTDLWGASELPGLWAAGEASCSGVHGANRLASNSLLEGLVFGPRAVEAILAGHTVESSGVMRSVFAAADATAAARTGGGAPGRDAVGRGATVPGGAVSATGETRGSAGGIAPGEPVGGAILRFDRAGVATSAGPGCDATELAKLRAELQRAMTFDAGVLRTSDSLARAGSVIARVRDRVGSPDTPERWELVNLCTTGAALVRAATARTESRGAHTRTDHPARDPAQRRRLVQRPD